MRFRVTLEGDQEMKRTLQQAAREYPKVVRKGTRAVAERLLALAQARAPYKTGRLVRSGKVSVSIRKAGSGGPNVLATIKFTEPYATRQHETHKTKSKFLESVIREAVPTAAAELAEQVQLGQALQGGGAGGGGGEA